MKARERHRIHVVTEIKFAKSNESIRRFFLDEVAKSDCTIACGAIDKSQVPASMRLKQRELYNDLCGKALSELFRRTSARNIYVALDRRSSKKRERDVLDSHIARVLHENHAGVFQPTLHVGHYDSMNCDCLQVQDFVTGAMFQRVERTDSKYADVISEKIASFKTY